MTDNSLLVAELTQSIIETIDKRIRPHEERINRIMKDLTGSDAWPLYEIGGHPVHPEVFESFKRLCEQLGKQNRIIASLQRGE